VVNRSAGTAGAICLIKGTTATETEWFRKEIKMPHRNLVSKEQRLALFLQSVVLTIGLAFVWTSSLQEPSHAQVLNPGQVRKVVKRIPKHLPLKLEVKNLDKETWVRDFALEVTNTSNKPIYFLEFWLVMPDVISENGHKVGFTLRHGRMEFVEFSTMARPDDLPILPGETYTFHISEEQRKGWENQKLAENRPDPVSFELSFTQLSFGDGTGFNGSDAKPYPHDKE
jgi:hypothetical protein